MKSLGKKIWGTIAAALLVLPSLTGLTSAREVKATEEPAKVEVHLHKKKMTSLPDELIQNTGKEMDDFDGIDGLADVTFKFYDVTAAYYEARENGESSEAAKNSVSVTPADTVEPDFTKTTNGSGDLIISLPKQSTVDGKLKDAVYTIVEVKKDGVLPAANMVIALPFYEMIKQDNGDYKYGNTELELIHLYPKNVVTVAGAMKLTKIGTGDGAGLSGAGFIISKIEAGVTKYLQGVRNGLYIWSTNENDAKEFFTGKNYSIVDQQGVDGTTGVLTISGLEHGAYKVIEKTAPENAAIITAEKEKDFSINESTTSTSPALVNVKNDTITVEKNRGELVDNSADLGQRIKYTINVNIPEGFNDKIDKDTFRYTSLQIFDMHDSVLTLDSADQTLKVGDTVIPHMLTENAAKDGFTVEPVNIATLRDYPGKTLTFTYYMYLNKDAVPATGYDNEAKVETGSLVDETEKTPEVFTGGKRFIKIDEDVTAKTPLAGAKFVVRDSKGADAKYLAFDENGLVLWVDTLAEAHQYVTKTGTEDDTDGIVDVKGLEHGKYYLEEIEAPEDYIKLSERLPFTVDSTSYYSSAEVLATAMDVPNKHKGLLPETGGNGIVAIIAVGLVAIVAAGGYFIYNKKHAQV